MQLPMIGREEQVKPRNLNNKGAWDDADELVEYRKADFHDDR